MDEEQYRRLTHIADRDCVALLVGLRGWTKPSFLWKPLRSGQGSKGRRSADSQRQIRSRPVQRLGVNRNCCVVCHRFSQSKTFKLHILRSSSLKLCDKASTNLSEKLRSVRVNCLLHFQRDAYRSRRRKLRFRASRRTSQDSHREPAL